MELKRYGWSRHFFPQDLHIRGSHSSKHWFFCIWGIASPSFPWSWNNCHTDHVEIKTESTKDRAPSGNHRKDQSWRRTCWSRTMELGFVEMGYPLICLGGLSFLSGIDQTTEEGRLWVELTVPYPRWEPEDQVSDWQNLPEDVNSNL